MQHYFTNKNTNSTGAKSYSYVQNQKYAVDFQVKSGNSYCKFDNTLLASSAAPVNFNIPNSLILFGRYSSSLNQVVISRGIRFCNALIYDENDNLTRELVPCFRKSDKCAGMYDVVNNKFYTNAGSGSFITGQNSTL